MKRHNYWQNMRTTSLKIFTTLLLLSVATSAALYFFRLDLLKVTFNQLMLDSELKIEEVVDVETNLNYLTIKKLTIAAGDKKLTLSLNDITLHYSLTNWHLDRVIVERAMLALQEDEEGRYPEKIPDAVSINDLLSILKEITLQKLI